MPIPRQVGSRLAGAGRRVEIGCDTAPRLAGAQRLAVLGFADRDIAGRKIRQDSRAGQRGIGARRDRRPHVLADLDVQHKSRQSRRLEHEIGAERYPLAKQRQLTGDSVAPRGELALLVKLAIIRQVRLRHDAKHMPVIHHHCTVEQLAREAQRRSHQQHRRQLAAALDNLPKRFRAGVEQGILVKQIFVGVRRDTELRKQHHRGATLGSLPCQLQCSLGVEPGIRHAQVGNADRCADKAVAVDRIKWTTHRIPVLLVLPITQGT